MKKRPRIGLNMSVTKSDAGDICLTEPAYYVDAVCRAHGVPVCLPSFNNFNLTKDVVSLLDGIIFIGGNDYRPEHYGGHSQPETELALARRDQFDWKLALYILEETNLPVLGICGGMQLIAIACGGKLIQDIKTEGKQSAGKQFLPHSSVERLKQSKQKYTHKIKVVEDSIVSSLLTVDGHQQLLVNSAHHQSVDNDYPGRGLRISALAPDGIVEALEPAADSDWAKKGRFLLGVQWHPERMIGEKAQLNIFRALVDAARINQGLHEK